MADTHYELDEAKPHASRLANRVREGMANLAALDDLFATMSHMRDGDGSQAAHFQKVVDLFGVAGTGVDGPAITAAKLVNAKAIFDELNSAQGNSAALRQFLSKLG